MLHLRMESNTVFILYSTDNCMFQTDDILRGGMAGGVYNYSGLVLVHLRTTVCGAFEAALLYHPCGGDFNHVSNYVVRDFVVRAVVCLG